MPNDKYSESMFPRPFGDSHVDALRSLLPFAKGQVGGWPELGGEIGKKDGPLNQDALNKFIRFQGKLKYPGDMAGIRQLHEDLYNFFRKRDRRLLDPLKPAFDHLYRGGGEVHRSTWRTLEAASQDTHLDEWMQQLIQGMGGRYYIYRYGFDARHKSSVFKSVIEIYGDERFGRSGLRFRAHYPPVDTPVANSDVYITGEILPVGQYLFFLGHDLNTDAPYVLAVKQPMNPRRAGPGAAITDKTPIHGLLMRFEGTDMVFAARAFIRRTDDNWETACGKSELVESKLFEREFPEFEEMKDFINNVIESSDRSVLGDFRSGAREEPLGIPE